MLERVLAMERKINKLDEKLNPPVPAADLTQDTAGLDTANTSGMTSDMTGSTGSMGAGNTVGNGSSTGDVTSAGNGNADASGSGASSGKTTSNASSNSASKADGSTDTTEVDVNEQESSEGGDS